MDIQTVRVIEETEDQPVKVDIKYSPAIGEKIPSIHTLLRGLGKDLVAARETADSGEVHVRDVSVAKKLVDNLNEVDAVSAWIAE